MENLSIKIIEKTPEIINGIPSCSGQIQIGSFSESFIMPLSWWCFKDYEIQWAEGIKKIEQGKPSCLVASMTNPENPMINWWLLYKEGNKIVIRNQILFGKKWKKILATTTFNPKNCYDFIPTNSKEKVSEWIIEAR